MEDLEESLDDELIPECKKMGSHIVFIESVYDTVKHPLGYLCNKINGGIINQDSISGRFVSSFFIFVPSLNLEIVSLVLSWTLKTYFFSTQFCSTV